MSGPAVRPFRHARTSLVTLLVLLLLALAGTAAGGGDRRPAGTSPAAMPAAAPDLALPLGAARGVDQPTNAGGLSALDGSLLQGLVQAPVSTLTEDPQPCAEEELPASESATLLPGRTVQVVHDASTLAVGPDAVSESTVIRAASLCHASLPPLDQGMTNVTKGPRRGYRFLPHMTFDGNLRVRLPYDKALIPPGLDEDDVHIFYYDEQAFRWRALERVELDTRAGAVTSLTDHFTDMIAATVTVPDHPETQSYSPTSISGIKAADPGAAVNLIDPPQANSHGDARLVYPIEVPPGRKGVQPQLGLSYSSAGSNGWLGVGWDLALPAVTIETRWGVPRYDAALETETYVLDGEQLAPVAHRGPPQPRTAEKVFHTRVEGSFRRIVRHGDHPTNYWWEVTSKDGVRSFYGGDPEAGGVAEARLTDAGGNVYRWALREVRDLHGNAVRYTYQTVSDPGVVGGTVQGRQLYLRSIDYTRSGTTPGAYTVTFIRDSELPGYVRRPDVVIDARGGFKQVTAELLGRIEVRLTGQLIRAYDLAYTQGAFGKTLLRTITQRGANNAVFTTHELSYFDEVRDGEAYNGFEPSTTWQTGNDNVTAGLLGHGQASALSGALSSSIGGHLYAGFNPVAPTKQLSGGAKVGFSRASNDGVLALVDLNGDNLPDKVFKHGGGIFVRLNTSGPDGSADFAATPTQAPGLPAISDETSNTFSFGGEAYFVANVFVNQAETFTSSSTYFSDVNGDGLPDLVRGGQVLFNHLDPNGVPTFTPDSNDTPVPVGDGAVDATGIVEDFEAIRQQQIANNPLQDTLRRWVAPFSGRVQISGTVTLLEDPSPERAAYQTADGVRVAIQHDGTELWSTVIGPDDHTPKTPTGVGSILVDKGDHLYFRVGSRFDGAFDQVAWDPQIAYLDVPPTTDVNNLDPYTYRASADFVLAGRRGISVQAPLAGTVRLTGDVHKAGATTDDITVLVVKNGATIFSQTLAAEQTGTIPVDQTFAVAKDDAVVLRVKVDSPIDVTQLSWVPRLVYVAAPGVDPITDANGDPLIELHPPYDVDLYPVTTLTAPQQPWVVPQDATVRITPQVTGSPAANGLVTFTVKRRGVLLAKRLLTVVGGVSSPVEFDLAVTQDQELFFDFSVPDPDLAEHLTGSAVTVTVQPDGDPVTVPSARHSAARPGLLPLPYRGWATAGYNANNGRDTAPVVEADLARSFTEESTFDPRTAKAYPFLPLPEEASWRGTDEHGWVKAATVSSSRLGLDQIGVPTPADFAGARAVERLSRTSQTAVGAGVSFVSGSTSTGGSFGEVDYLDLNGDRFPDVVGNGRVQYTTPTGGLEAGNRAIAGLGKPRDSDASALNVGVGGSPAAFFASARGEVDTASKSHPRSDTTGSQMTPLGLSAGLGRGDSDPNHDLLDVNGDGLPDRVTNNGSELLVALNLGYQFAPAEPWGTAAINDGASENGSIGASLGFNGGIYDFAGGASLTKNKSQTSQTLLDLNGDGLLDRILPNGDGGMRVGFNTGAGFAPPVAWAGALNGVCADDTSVGLAGIDWDTVRLCSGNTGLGGGAYFTIGIGPLCLLACYVIINPGADASQNMAREEASLRDVDGDGYADHVASTDDASMRVARNRTGRTNLLKSIERPLGARIELEYQRDGNTTDQPHSRWVLSRTRLFDGHPGDGADTQVTTYTYENGVFDRLEREFYGYGRVTEQHRNPADNSVYRSVVREFRTDSYYTRGLPARVLTMDGAGRIFTETEHTYLLRDVTTGAEPADPASTTATIFPQLVRTDERFYEGNPTPGKSTSTTQSYDALGNVTQMVDTGDSGAGDDVIATIGYTECASTYVVGVADAITVTGSDGTELRRREGTIDCATGNLTQVRQFLADGTAATTDLAYFANGNLRQVTNPPNHQGQRYQLTYDYDPIVATHVTRVTDSFGLSSTSAYDLRYGTVLETVDTNNNRTSYTYDDVGRMTSVTGPYEQGGATPTIRFEYHPEAAVPWALTRHLDSFRSATDTIDTVQFIDGLKRGIQTKKDLTVHTGPGSSPVDVMQVSGRVTFDFVGRTVETFYPVTEPLGTPGTFNASHDTVQPTRLTYDVTDRNTSITLPDGSVTTTEWGFGPDRDGVTQFRSIVTDPNGNQKRTYRNVRELLVGLQEFHTPAGGSQQEIWTSYAYDALSQLVEIRDDHGNITRTAYDNLGRRVRLENPDTGTTEMVFDLASNPIAKITANLRAEGEQITYTYDFNRLVSISYPNFSGNNVTYTYGAPGAADNRAGRTVLVTDESGSEERFYGKLGEIVKEIKTVASDTGSQPEVYTTQYTYDTFGRLQQLIYPDGEVLTYRYDSGGQVRAASGVKGSHTYSYVTRLEYDKFEQRAFVEAGNGVRTNYTYDPLDRRLANLRAGHAGGTPFQNLNYTYDGVGNVTRLSNDVPVPPPSQDGGPTVQTFTYDDLDRLIGAAGSYQFAPDKLDRYSLTLAYDSIHNLTAKHQTHEIVQPSGGTVPQHKTSYTYAYAYGGAGPHAATHIGERTFAYDANGNQLGWDDDTSGQRRTIVWDEENRVQSIFDNGHEKTYKYDDAGERVIKRGPQGETAYVNQYFSIRNREVGTKHVFVGATRLVSKLMKQDKPNGNPNGNQSREKDLYFFHSDHLTSTNYVTDANGRIFEHLEYFPSGETWVEESSNTQRTPYLFSGKELDEETGLYYFGARYYDPRTGVFASPDPAFERNLRELPEDPSKPSGGPDPSAPSFLNVYNYADANPLSKADPDGRQAVPLTTTRLRAIATAQGIGAGLSGVQFNRAVGRAFQEFALTSMGLRENFTPFASPARAAATGGLPASVIPDSVRAVKEVRLRWGFWPTVTLHPNSSFFEVKAVRGTIHLSHSNHQIRGLIDVAARSPAGAATGPRRPLPLVTFITTADTVIGQDVLAEATRRGVAVWQAIAYEIPSSSGGPPQIVIGPIVPLNPGAYPSGRAVPVPGGAPGTLGGPILPHPPHDPDPPEVQ